MKLHNYSRHIKAPYSVVISLTEKCNANCIGCFNPHFGEKDSDFDVIKQIIDLLCEHGVKRISFGGGESVLRADLPHIIEYTHSKGVTTVVSTNGIYFIKNPDQIKLYDPILDEIIIDYHSTNPEISRGFSQYMDQDHLNKIEDIFRLILESTSIQLKVATVLFKKNANQEDLFLTGNRLSKIGIHIWKIDQYFHVDKSTAIKESLSITDSKYDELFTLVRNTYENLKIIGLGVKFKRKQRNFMISPAGNAFINYKGKSEIVGNIFKDYKKLFQKYQSPLPLENYELLPY